MVMEHTGLKYEIKYNARLNHGQENINLIFTKMFKPLRCINLGVHYHVLLIFILMT